MALFRKKNSEQETPKKAFYERHAELKEAGRINARIIDAASGLTVLTGIYAVRMNDEGVRHLFMNDYHPTIGQVNGDVVFLTAKGEKAYRGIRGFYKLQHNEFTLLIEGKLGDAREEGNE